MPNGAFVPDRCWRSRPATGRSRLRPGLQALRTAAESPQDPIRFAALAAIAVWTVLSGHAGAQPDSGRGRALMLRQAIRGEDARPGFRLAEFPDSTQHVLVADVESMRIDPSDIVALEIDHRTQKKTAFVTIHLTDALGARLKKVSAEHVGKDLAIDLKGRILDVVTIRSALSADVLMFRVSESNTSFDILVREVKESSPAAKITSQ